MNISKTPPVANPYQAEQLKTEKRAQVSAEAGKKSEEQLQQSRITQQSLETKKAVAPNSKVGVNLDQQA